MRHDALLEKVDPQEIYNLLISQSDLFYAEGDIETSNAYSDMSERLLEACRKTGVTLSPDWTKVGVKNKIQHQRDEYDFSADADDDYDVDD